MEMAKEMAMAMAMAMVMEMAMEMVMEMGMGARMGMSIITVGSAVLILLLTLSKLIIENLQTRHTTFNHEGAKRIRQYIIARGFIV